MLLVKLFMLLVELFVMLVVLCCFVVEWCGWLLCYVWTWLGCFLLVELLSGVMTRRSSWCWKVELYVMLVVVVVVV